VIRCEGQAGKLALRDRGESCRGKADKEDPNHAEDSTLDLAVHIRRRAATPPRNRRAKAKIAVRIAVSIGDPGPDHTEDEPWNDGDRPEIVPTCDSEHGESDSYCDRAKGLTKRVEPVENHVRRLRRSAAARGPLSGVIVNAGPRCGCLF
jgi:hypothetical protein